MPSFCRHNRLLQNCPICSREQSVELRPILSSSAPRATEPRTRTASAAPRRRERSPRAPTRAGVTVRRLRDAVDDGYRSPLATGLKSSDEARRLAEELAFAVARLELLSRDPPGLYARVAAPDAGIEERTWLAFEIAYLAPLDDEDPFAAIAAAHKSWASGEEPELDGVQTGPRTAHDPDRGARTLVAYRNWTRRAGSQAAAFGGEHGWSPGRRFSRAFERLALPGLHRDARFDLLVTLGRLGVYELQAETLALGGADLTTVGAKRALGIGDSMLLERRAAQLAEACGIPLEALDLGFYNWERGERANAGLAPDAAPDATALRSASAALEI